ncbi:MAG: IS30 family transposase, partial [Flavobacteriales bacterium]|nr:IS30 family transposase [Flavobacteriales bacterium]
MSRYNQINQEERYEIYALRKAGISQKEVAKRLNRDPSSISRELKRNAGKRSYRPKQAHEKAITRRFSAPRIDDQLIEFVKKKVIDEWSPEQISGWLKKYSGRTVSHEWIYQHIWKDKTSGGLLFKSLRHAQKKKKKRYGSNDTRGQIKNRVSIDERPEIVEDKSRIGDWEIDTMIGKNHKGALVTIVDRKSKFTLIAQVDRKQSVQVKEATLMLLNPFKSISHTITADNGKEFASHEEIALKLKLSYFFAHPYSSWERGLNENTNGLIRQYFPKGTDFQFISQTDVEKVAEKLNNRPRKTLNYKT